MKKSILILCVLLLMSQVRPISVSANNTLTNADIYKKRRELYETYSSITLVPWYILAAIDQYERNVRRSRPDIPNRESGVIDIYFDDTRWDSVAFDYARTFALGHDGDGDGVADRNNDADVLFSMASYIASYGWSEPYIRIALWDWYGRDVSVSTIMNFAKIYQKFNRIDLNEHVLPMPRGYNWTIKSNFGAARSFGGRRSHEGVDIFAGYGVPVRATTYGVVELKGWNRLGGWRIGIRDLSNNYQYYAHLNGFSKDINVGSIVEPGTIIGWCGASGYGPPGTSGKFPPHLHFGMYHDNGRNEWPVDPYGYLLRWGQEERMRQKEKS
ncbi:MAG: M23 family metallopeptidase [Bacilli bacterium]